MYLWLDYSQVTGTLNQMRVARLGGEANVRLVWEGVNENVESGPCEHWRVLVVAIRKIYLLSRSYVRLQRSSSHFTNYLTMQEGASWKSISNSTTCTAYIRDKI
jgi:hypothetical protein